MESVFIGARELVLHQTYSRADTGYEGTQIAFMGINDNEHEQIAFINLGDQYDNRLTRDGLILDPRKGFTPKQKDTYLFLRKGTACDYYYMGVIGRNSIRKHGETRYYMFAFNAAEIPGRIVSALGGFKSLPPMGTPR